MGTLTFLADVTGGQLRYDESLIAFEGRQVRVTVALSAPSILVSDNSVEAGDEGPPEGMDVENDVLLEMPRTQELLKDAVVVDKGVLPPTVILPEDLPDE